MHMKYFLPILITVFTSCHSKDPVKQDKKGATGSNNVVAECDYEKRKLGCRKLLATYNDSKKMSDGKQLQIYFADSLLPCWYGTPWDYNGMSLSPAKGNIACGYFITTTLMHAGLAVNRIKMAQCPSSELIRSVCTGIKIYSNKPVAELINQVKKDGMGLYIAGLDFHTGFIWYDGSEVYFIHASYYGSKCVVREKAAGCAVLTNSKLKMTGKVNFMQ